MFKVSHYNFHLPLWDTIDQISKNICHMYNVFIIINNHSFTISSPSTTQCEAHSSSNFYSMYFRHCPSSVDSWIITEIVRYVWTRYYQYGINKILNTRTIIKIISTTFIFSAWRTVLSMTDKMHPWHNIIVPFEKENLLHFRHQTRGR